MRAAPVLAVLLLLSPLVGAAAAWLPRRQELATVGAALVSLGLSAVIAGTYDGPLRFSLWIVGFHLDALSIYFVLLVNLVALAAACYAGPALARRTGPPDQARFYGLFNLFHFTMVLVPMVENLVVLWIAIELTTLTSTFLVAWDGRREALEAAWKYIIITSTGIIFALLGTFFLASAIPADRLTETSMSWPDLLRVAGALDDDLVRLSFLFVLVGYGTKAGLAPMHTWLPDGHGEAPFPVSALLSGVLLKCALYAILRFYTITNQALGDGGVFASRLLLASGLLSLVVATPFILKRNPFKRVLAYHSLEHMGIITFGIGVGGSVALFGALLHALNHGVTKSMMFLAYGNLQERRGVLQATPWTGMVLAVGGLALVGSPPFNIFFSELLILWAAVSRAVSQPSVGMVGAIALFLVSVTLIFGGLVRHLSRILLGGAADHVPPETARQVVPLLGLLVLVVLFGFTVPSLGPLHLKDLLEESVRIVCEGAGCR